jgi:hypothetical protein
VATKFHHERFHNFSVHRILIAWAGYVACTNDTRNFYRTVVGKPEGKRPDGGHRRGWDVYIKRGYGQIDCRFMDRFIVAHKPEAVYYEHGNELSVL